MMKIASIAAGAFAMAASANLPSASAADLSYGYSDYDRQYQSSIYDNKYSKNYDDDYSSYKDAKSYKDYDRYDDYDRRSYKDDYFKQADKHYSYKENVEGKYGHSVFRDIPEASYYSHCLKPRRIHRMLRRQGWYDFQNLRIRNFVFRVRARRDDGQLYRLRVDRCTGDIIRAKPLWNQYRAFRYWRGKRGY